MHLQSYPIPAHCVSNSEKRNATEQPCHSAFLHIEAIDTQQKNALCTVHLPSPAPARSAVKRKARVTTGHNPHRVLTICTAKERDGYPQVCCKSPLFLLHRARRSSFSPAGRKRRGGCISTKEMGVHPQPRAPAAAAAIRSATARRAALSAQMRVSFSPAGKKRNGGA